MKGFFFVLTCCYFSIVNAQFIDRSGIVKLQTRSSLKRMVEHGTGNIIGSDSGYLYLLTAAHVVFPLDGDGEIIDSTPTLVVIIPGMEDKITDSAYFHAEVIAKDHARDILIARIPAPGFLRNAKEPIEYGFVSFIRGLDTLSGCASLYRTMSLTGFSGAAVKETETLSGQLYTRTLSDDSKYFLMKEVPVEKGFSGSLVQWLDGQVVGMLLSKMNNDQAKIIRLETIDKFLRANKIPDNLLKSHSLLGQWQCDSIVLHPGGPASSLTRNKKMVFKSNGEVEGLGNGTFCFTPEGIQLQTKDTLEIPNGDFTALYMLSMEGGHFKLDDPSSSYMWNFSGPNPKRRRLSNNHFTIYLTKND